MVALKCSAERVDAAHPPIEAGPKLGSSNPNGPPGRRAGVIRTRLNAVGRRLGLAKSGDLAAAEAAIAASGILLTDWYLER